MKGSFYGKGDITSFSTDPYELHLGKFAIKTNNSEIDSLIKEGVTVRCQYEYTDPSLKGINDFIGYAWPILENGKYAQVSLHLTVSEVDPYDATTVFTNGSFRGMVKTLKRGMNLEDYGDAIWKN